MSAEQQSASPDIQAPQSRTFEADVAKLLHLMVHSVYSEKDVFLRELVSNAADACEKLRYEALSHPEILGEDQKGAIRITLDPDNRRPVNFKAREAALANISRELQWSELIADAADGRIKLAWTRHLLALRNTHPAVFESGSYLPLDVTGPHRDHVIAFARIHRKEAMIVAAMRWFAPFTDGGRKWPNGAIEGAVRIDGFHVNGATRAGLPLSELFATLPVAAREATVKRTHKKAARDHGRAA